MTGIKLHQKPGFAIDQSPPAKQRSTLIQWYLYKYFIYQVNYYHANYIKELVPFSTLTGLLKEDISQEQLLDSYDPFVGNALYIHLLDNGSQLWFYASGKALNILSNFIFHYIDT